MASEPAKQPGQLFLSILRCLKIFLLNSWRRLIIMGRYAIICFHQQRLCRAWRLLGKQIHQAVEGGEVNPMLTEEVQDLLTRALVIQETKQRHYQAVAALREKIRACRAGEQPAPAEGQGPQESPEPEPGREEGQG